MTAALFPLAFISPFICFLMLVGIKEKREHPVFKAIAIGLCAGVAFYGMRCDATTDIARHIALLPLYQTSFFDCFGAGHYNGLFVWDIWNWNIAKIGDPYLLQSSAAFVGYAIVAYIAIDYFSGRRDGQKLALIAMVFAFCAIPILPLVAGIRSSVSVLLCALFFYLYCKKGIPLYCTILGMVAGVMIHQVALFPLAIMLFAIAFRKRPYPALIACFLAFAAIAFIGEFLLPYLSGGGPIADFIQKAVESLLSYEVGNEWTAANAGSLNGIVTRFFSVMLTLFLIVVSLARIRADRKDEVSYSISFYVALLSVASLALVFVLPVNGERFLPAAFALGAVEISDFTWRVRGKRGITAIVATSFLFITCSISLALHIYSVAYGSLSSSMLLGTSAFGVFGFFMGIQ